MTIKPSRKTDSGKKYKRFLRLNLIFSLMLSLMLSGCSEYKENFVAKPGKGSGWRSMSDTYRFNEQHIPPEETVGKTHVTPVDLRVKHPSSVLCDDQQTLERLPEKTLKVWFAPFQDEMNNLYEESVVQTIVQKGSWAVHHVKGFAS